MTKTILITGATDGIGLLTAKKLATAGHHVLLHGRSQDKLAKAQAEVTGTTETYLADLSSISDVIALADAITAKHSRLDVVINNAGVLKVPQTKTASGRDVRFEVNTIAPYILTQKLLPIIPSDGRIINLSSAAQAAVDVDAMATFKPMDDMGAYAQSKLAITIWTAAMARDYPNGPVFIAVNPGSLLASKMVKEGFGVAGSDLNIGADILIATGLDADFAEASGKYFDNDAGHIASPHAAALDANHVQAVMQALDRICAPHLA